MTIAMTGGGSGGHITPIMAVADELKRLQPDVKLIYIGQRGDPFVGHVAEHSNIDQVFTVRAGKFRRYHGAGWKQLLDIPTLYKNARDLLFVTIGIVQAWWLLRRLKPAVLFSRGGYVSVPVGLAAAFLKIPYTTHDADPVPSLTNRIIAPWASVHAVALPPELYNYPIDKTVTTGIPLRAEFKPVTAALKKQYRQALDIPEKAKLLFIIGGGLGAVRINLAVAQAVPHLLSEFKDLYVIHGVGQANEAQMDRLYKEQMNIADYQRLRVFGFAAEVYRMSGAADLIITRAGATNLAEFALQGRACIVIPSPYLTGGHQIQNAQYLADQGAAVVVSEAELEEDPNRLAKQVSDMLRHPDKQLELAKNLHRFAKPHATHDLAEIILKLAKHEAV